MSVSRALCVPGTPWGLDRCFRLETEVVRVCLDSVASQPVLRSQMCEQGTLSLCATVTLSVQWVNGFCLEQMK